MRDDEAIHSTGDSERAAALRKSRNLMIASVIVMVFGTIPMFLYLAGAVSSGGSAGFPLFQILVMIGAVAASGILNILAMHTAGKSVLDVMSRRGALRDVHRPPWQ